MKQRQRISLQPAFLLHRRAFRDAAMIADFITRDCGRVALVARGAGKGSRRCLDAFTPLLLSFNIGTDLGSLSAVEAGGHAFRLGREQVFCAYYANELLLRMTHRGEPVPEIFTAYGDLLADLAEPTSALRGLRLFEKRLLDQLGYGADLAREWQSGSPVDPDASYRVLPEQGPEPVASGSAIESGAIFSGVSLLSLAREDLSTAQALRDARRLLRLWLDYYLDGKPLKSRHVMQAMRKQMASADAASTCAKEF